MTRQELRRQEVEYVDMMRSGRNPARIVPLIRAFLDSHSERPVRFVGEPIWAGRTAAEIAEGSGRYRLDR